MLVFSRRFGKVSKSSIASGISASDLSVQPEICGAYVAFALLDSADVLHLKRLSSAGITYIHLLPTFQFVEVYDQKENWRFVGSYASNPNGLNCTIEFHKMIKTVDHIGLRVVLDVVYNHLQVSGPLDEHFVLDKGHEYHEIVPGYYLRRNGDGFIEHNTYMNNTANDHFMIERLILDDLVQWAINYKVLDSGPTLEVWDSSVVFKGPWALKHHQLVSVVMFTQGWHCLNFEVRLSCPSRMRFN
ncbi:Pullulanase 1 [Spatholobus suberectus]|nr:Pullulanase 1 [Spatholobus suberectus]